MHCYNNVEIQCYNNVEIHCYNNVFLLITFTKV